MYGFSVSKMSNDSATSFEIMPTLASWVISIDLDKHFQSNKNTILL